MNLKEYYDANVMSDQVSRGWRVKDEWIARARDDFQQTLKDWAKQARANKDDGFNHARLAALQQVLAEFEGRNSADSRSMREIFDNVCHQVNLALTNQQDEWLYKK